MNNIGAINTIGQLGVSTTQNWIRGHEFHRFRVLGIFRVDMNNFAPVINIGTNADLKRLGGLRATDKLAVNFIGRDNERDDTTYFLPATEVSLCSEPQIVT